MFKDWVGNFLADSAAQLVSCHKLCQTQAHTSVCQRSTKYTMRCKLSQRLDPRMLSFSVPVPSVLSTSRVRRGSVAGFH